MPEVFPWYEAVQGEQLEQGDCLRGCPSYHLAGGTVVEETMNAVVLSHSCDLANDKLEVVQLCPYWPLDAIATEVEYFRSKRGREDLRRGNVPGYHLLNRCGLPGLECDFLVVDFRSLFSVHLATLQSKARDQSPRLRLRPPYREHLAQAFARFFKRIGLPVDVPPFQ